MGLLQKFSLVLLIAGVIFATAFCQDDEDLISALETKAKAKHYVPRKITVRVNSEGCCGAQEAHGIHPFHYGPIFFINNEATEEHIRGKGWNFLAISRETGEILGARNFAVTTTAKDVNAMWVWVKGLPDDTIVLVAVLDDGARHCNNMCWAAIREVGADLLPIAFRDGYALIGYKGSHCGTRPSWRREFRRKNIGFDRSGFGPEPISLVSEINLDDCY